MAADPTSVDLDALVAMRTTLRAIDASLLTGAQCRAVAEELAKVSKAALAAAARVAARAAACGAHRDSGSADAADWWAKATGTTRGAARRAMEGAERLGQPGGGCEATAAALASGELSVEEADEIARTEAEAPGSEAALLALARRDGLAGVRDEARRRRQQAMDEEALARRQRAARSLRTFTDELGMVALRGALLPGLGTALAARVEAEAHRLRRAAQAAGGEVEPLAAYAHDALLAMVGLSDERTEGEDRGMASADTGDGGGGGGDSGGSGGGAIERRRAPRKAEVVFVCDLGAARRGHAHPGEPCHVLGGGRVPVSAVIDALDDAFVKLVTHDGVKIDTVLHLGRYRRAELETALNLGAPPDFAGVTCIGEGCTKRHGLQWDHVDPVANDGPTSFENLVPRCWVHHQEKTERDRQAGLLDGKRRRDRPRDPDAPGASGEPDDGGGDERRPP